MKKVVSVALNNQNTQLIIVLEDGETVIECIEPNEALERLSVWQLSTKLGLYYRDTPL